MQNSTNVGAGGVYGLVALEIISSGSSPGEIVTGVDFNLNGTTDPSDIRELRLYRSNSSEFSIADALLLATASAEAGRFDINAPITSSTHYLWLAAELAGTSDDADVLDAEITGFTLAGVSAGRFVPAITSPDGFLTVQRNGFHSLVIRRQGDDGVNTYRIPGLATSNDGTLLAVFDIRNDGSGDLPGNIDVGLMRSTDGGYTWGAMQAIMDFDAGVSDSSGNGVGDPAILVVRVNGRIWCAALGSFGNNAWNGSGPGLTKEETGQFYLSYSDDDGVTWSEPYSITSQIKEAAWNLYFMGPGKGICLRDGTLIFPAQYRDASGVAHANFIYSKDRGQTWQNSPPAYVNGSEWTSEAQMVELDNGDLLISMRNYLSRKERLWNIYSWDQENESIADGRWGDAWYNETDPTVMASVETYSSMIDGDPWSGILFANPDSTSRDKMTIRLSLDQGQSWPYRRKIDDRPAAYSCMTILPDGDIGILYETGDANAYQTLTFARFPLDWIVGNEDTDGDGVSDFEEMARRGPPKSLTELRSVAPVSLIPFPRDLLWLNDDCNTSRVVIERPAESGPVLDHAETRLRDALLAAGSVFTEADGSETCVIRLIIGAVPNPDGSDEVYLLETAADSVTIRAPTEAGLLYGVQTLEQLVMADQSGPRIAACSIIDWPAFGIRGFMHDVGRNFQPIELLKKQVDAFARYKLNFFHWHLTENAAWRIESKLYPQLTDAAYHWETREPGQFYTQQEIVDFVNYCAERNITVIPEIDIPGHSEAFRRAMNVTMGERAAVDILVALTNELCDLLPADLVPYIHFGTDEVRIAAENPHPDLIPSLVSTARNRGRKVITWWSGITPVDNQVINQLWASYAPRANNPYIDSRSNYINHLDAFDGPIRAYFQQVCRVPKETDQALGGILCYWPDVNIDDPFHGLGIVPVFPTMVTYSERVWRGADRDYPEYWAKLPPADSPLFEEFAEFEKDLLSHRDRYFSGELPFPYVSQTQLPWKIVGPFDHGGNLAQSFGPEEEILPSYASGGQTLAWSDALGGTIHLDHFFGFESYSSASVGTYYAMTQVVSDTDREVDFWFQFGTPSVSRRRNGGNPPLGEWNAYEAKVWVNGESIDPPIWQNPGLLPDFGDEIPFTNEGYFYRESTRVTLKAGSNQILLRIPQGANNGFPAGKWMFSAMPIAWDGSQASELEGISFQAEVPELLPTRIEKDSADLEHRFEGNDIYNGSSYINGWTEWNSGAASESLSDSDLNRTHTNGSESWIGGATMSKDGVNTWDSGNGGDWTLELR
ncbi:MAG: family 20 glycosylhydrolase, partial [Luteolibacter sp.]